MFHPGNVLKVKVEIAPGEVGFGRATVIDRVGSQILIQIKTTKESNKAFEKGTKLWFVSDTTTSTFNGMWASSVIEQRLVGGRKAMLCSAPKLEPIVQRRGQSRAKLDVAVKLKLADCEEPIDFRSVDICQSGMSVVSSSTLSTSIDAGDMVGILVATPQGEFFSSARVVRVELNWLVNKVEIGVEFMEMQKDAEEILDKILVVLGEMPRDSQNLERLKEQTQQGGLSRWVKTFSGLRAMKPSDDAAETEPEKVQEKEQDQV